MARGKAGRAEHRGRGFADRENRDGTNIARPRGTSRGGGVGGALGDLKQLFEDVAGRRHDRCAVEIAAEE
jgi:hypothetical protein